MSIYLGTAEIDSLKLGTADVSRVMLGNAEVWSAFDPDAADYFARIVSAGSSISVANKAAVDAFVRGCKTDGIWSAIKASCLLAGPDDLTGALVPLVGTAPSNAGSAAFVSGDYNRTGGLTTNSTSKHLNSNYSNAAGLQNNVHVAAYQTTPLNQGIVGTTRAVTGSVTLFSSGVNRCQSTNTYSSGRTPTAGFYGQARDNSSNVNCRSNGTTTNHSSASQSPSIENFFVFRFVTDTASSSGTLSFYSIGESLDLALLDARLATYMSSLT
jgi:hypothetical protein